MELTVSSEDNHHAAPFITTASGRRISVYHVHVQCMKANRKHHCTEHNYNFPHPAGPLYHVLIDVREDIENLVLCGVHGRPPRKKILYIWKEPAPDQYLLKIRGSLVKRTHPNWPNCISPTYDLASVDWERRVVEQEDRRHLLALRPRLSLTEIAFGGRPDQPDPSMKSLLAIEDSPY